MALPLIAAVSTLTTEEVQVAVQRWHQGRALNPTTMGVQFALAAEGTDPGENDWFNGGWDVANRTYMAVGTFGPAVGRTLTPGEWVLWVRIISNPEQPVRALGLVTVT